MKYAKVSAEVVYGGDNVFQIIGTAKRQVAKEYGADAAKEFVADCTSKGSYHEVLGYIDENLTVG